MSESDKSKKAGKKIGKYQNAVLLAKGGMGAIYKADHPTLDKPVVLKMLTLTGSDQFAQRFQREATIMMGFQHVNIVNYYDHFKTAKSYCMVMEYVDGCSVAQLLEKHRYLDDDVALLILRDTLQALLFAHEKGVVHRDIKPANILISKTGEVKLTDFGIAHNDELDTDGLTKEGMTLGTPSYMAPEQFRDAGHVDARADVYSSGVLLYECLTGRKPFAGASLPDLLERVRKGQYERLGKIRPESSFLSRRIVRRAVRSNPRRRFHNVQEMLKPLNRHFERRNKEAVRKELADLVSDRRKSRVNPKINRKKILRIGMAVAASLATLAVLGGIWWTLAVKGFLPAFLLPNFAGGIRLEVALPDNSVLPPDLPPGVMLDVFQYGDDGEGNLTALPVKSSLSGREPFADILSRFFASGKQSEEKAEEKAEESPLGISRLVVPPVILKPGLYQLKIHIGDEITSRAIQVPSMRNLRKSFESGGTRQPLVNLNLTWTPESTAVPVHWTVYRNDTGFELTDYPEPRVVGADGKNHPVRGREVLLNTGTYYDFTFDVPGYESRTVRAWLESGISNYSVEVSLLPEPAVLSLSSSLFLKRPRIQGEFYYRYGGREGGFQRVPFLGKESKELVLLPGEYSVICGPEGQAAELKLNLKPADAFSYRLERDEDKNLKWIEVTNE